LLYLYQRRKSSPPPNRADDTVFAKTSRPLIKHPSRSRSHRDSTASIHRQPAGHVSQRNQGFHFGVLCAAVVIASVFIINVVLTTWASSRYGVKGGLGTLQSGACSKTRNLATWLHLGINVLSTLLLGASNYAMQCLSAPTRDEIDKAHRRGLWMDIGVPSVRNLWRISPSRLFMWCLVAASSIPLHLMYNSAVFSTLSAREYSVFTVTKDFLTGAPYNISQTMYNASLQSYAQPMNDVKGSPYYSPAVAAARSLRGNLTQLQRLENKACIEEYSKEIISMRSDVLLISSDDNNISTVLDFWPTLSPSFADPQLRRPPWPCDYSDGTFHNDVTCDVRKKAAEASTWQINNRLIQYCLSKPIEEQCRLQFSVRIMAVVIACNLVKMIVMGYIAWKRPLNLVTAGDAIASFLDKPDQTTEGNCLAGKTRFQKTKSWDMITIRWEPITRYWFHAASKKRWLICNIL